MTKARYTSEVLIQNGKIRRSTPVGLENATAAQREAIVQVKPLMNAWLRSKLSENENSLISVRSKYVETSNGLTVEFKIQQVAPNG